MSVLTAGVGSLSYVRRAGLRFLGSQRPPRADGGSVGVTIYGRERKVEDLFR